MRTATSETLNRPHSVVAREPIDNPLESLGFATHSVVRQEPDDLLKQVVRTIFERELWRMQRPAQESDSPPTPNIPESFDRQLRTLLGKRYPSPGRATGRFSLRWGKWARERLFKDRIRQEFYRFIFHHTLEHENLAATTSGTPGDEWLCDRLQAPFQERLLALLGSPNGEEGADRFDRCLENIDRRMRACLDWCVSLLPYHRPVLRDRDLDALLTQASHAD